MIKWKRDVAGWSVLEIGDIRLLIVPLSGRYSFETRVRASNDILYRSERRAKKMAIECLRAQLESALQQLNEMENDE